jgi:hypothetical protein
LILSILSIAFNGLLLLNMGIDGVGEMGLTLLEMGLDKFEGRGFLGLSLQEVYVGHHGSD